MRYGVSTPRGTTRLLYLHARPISKEKLFLSLLSTFPPGTFPRITSRENRERMAINDAK